MKLAALLLMLPLAAQTPAPVDGQTLPKVPGPIVTGSALKDMAGDPGDSRMDRQMRRTARRTGPLPCVVVPIGEVAIAHGVALPAGWMAYQVEAGPLETVKAALQGDHPAWFRVKVVNKFGQLEKGMLQNLIPRGEPQASYINPKAAPAKVFFVVDTTLILNSAEPYTLTFTRSQAPARP